MSTYEGEHTIFGLLGQNNNETFHNCLKCSGEGVVGGDGGGNLTSIQCKAMGILTMTPPPVQWIYANKIKI
jgi:hypothetical protein